MSTLRSRRTLKFVIERLRADLAQQKQEHFPGANEGPAAMLNLFSGLVDTAEGLIELAAQQGVTPAQADAYVRRASQLVLMAYRELNIFRGAGREQLPFTVVSPLQRWFDDLLGTPNHTVFTAEIAANYELATIDHKDLSRIANPSKTLTDAIAAIKAPLRVVTVPAKAFAILPNLAIVAHEIGHALYQRPKQDPLQVHLADLQARITKRAGASSWTPSLNAELTKISSSWYEELCADAYMFFLTGPAGFFSLCEALQFFSKNLYGYSDSHPASSLRRQFLFYQLTKGKPSYADVFQKHTAEPLTQDITSPLLKVPHDADEVFNGLPGIPVEKAAVIAELHVTMHHARDFIYSEVQTHLTGVSAASIYTPQKYDVDLTNHLTPLLAAVPPIETGDLQSRVPAEFASILNVGWAVLLTKLTELRVRTDGQDPLGVQRLDRLHSLLVKAVELAEARRTWMSTPS